MALKRMLAGIVVLCVACAPEPPATLSPDTPVAVSGGSVTGAVTDRNPDIMSFLGIPYAAPPVGDLRWKLPAPVVSWTGTKAATEYGPNCVGGGGRDASEDCLYLNVWAQREKTEAQPVMVWIHGGGYTGGSGSGGSYVGTNLAARGVVVVTINYRLNVFGFMAHPALSAESGYGGSGNYGVADMVAALEWVRDNIAQFGGDPDNVTIFGESAGGGAVMTLLVVPQTEGLFDRAIGESNWVNGWDRKMTEPMGDLPPAEETGVRVAENLGGSGGAATLAEMRAADANAVLTAYRQVEYSPYTHEGYQWAPAVDGHFIPDDPMAMYQSGRQHDVPIIVGMNGNEGILFTRRLGIDHVSDFERLVRQAYPDQADDLMALYHVETDADAPVAMAHLVHDFFFAGPVMLMARSHANVSSPAYLYHFTRVPPTAWGATMGSHHTAEIRYVFGNLTGPGAYAPPLAADGEEPSGLDKAISENMMSYWVQFAKTGNPNVEGQPEWPEYDPSSDTYLEIGDEVMTGKGLHHRGAVELYGEYEAEKRGGS